MSQIPTCKKPGRKNDFDHFLLLVYASKHLLQRRRVQIFEIKTKKDHLWVLLIGTPFLA